MIIGNNDLVILAYFGLFWGSFWAHFGLILGTLFGGYFGVLSISSKTRNKPFWGEVSFLARMCVLGLTTLFYLSNHYSLGRLCS